MADKIKVIGYVNDFGDSEYSVAAKQVPVVRLSDHQAAMREAVLLVKSMRPYVDSKNLLNVRIEAFLSAHQECGGGGE